MMPFRLFRKKNISKTESDNFCSRMKLSPFSAVPPADYEQKSKEEYVCCDMRQGI